MGEISPNLVTLLAIPHWQWRKRYFLCKYLPQTLEFFMTIFEQISTKPEKLPKRVNFTKSGHTVAYVYKFAQGAFITLLSR